MGRFEVCRSKARYNAKPAKRVNTGASDGYDFEDQHAARCTPDFLGIKGPGMRVKPCSENWNVEVQHILLGTICRSGPMRRWSRAHKL